MSNNEHCLICRSASETDLVKASSGCDHADSCKSCLEKHIESQCNTKVALQVTCPKPSCRKELGYHDIRKLAQKQLFERYDNLLLRHAIRKLPDFRWCKVANCGWGQEHTTGDDEPVMTCHACNAKSCFTHDVPWHTNMTCDEFDESLKKGDNATRVYYEQHTKSCPECKEAIEKNDGCDHMTCRCGHEFCWLCLSPFRKISRYGNHHHERTCQYYADYTPESDEADFELMEEEDV
ncbi:11623_t:CDS:2 [Paraglomus brasilianum]|uniref:RBR-type E3 ubiquitin transferase n=1 Tax=Paraglomus brasilianum TaxID=144538 RepID=A0A9N9FGR4_9GLOM|nr:11623_t:CDS:2 [Paraglomus brasilianum]